MKTSVVIIHIAGEFKYAEYINKTPVGTFVIRKATSELPGRSVEQKILGIEGTEVLLVYRVRENT